MKKVEVKLNSLDFEQIGLDTKITESFQIGGMKSFIIDKSKLYSPGR